MNESKLIRGVKVLKALGYAYVLSVVKTVYDTYYYHAVGVDELLETGRWIPAQVGMYAGRQGHWRGRLGTSNPPAAGILRKYVYRLANATLTTGVCAGCGERVLVAVSGNLRVPQPGHAWTGVKLEMDYADRYSGG